MSSDVSDHRNRAVGKDRKPDSVSFFSKEVVGWGDLDEEDINLMKQQRDAMLVYRGALRTRMVKAMKKIIKGVDGLGTGRQE